MKKYTINQIMEISDRESGAINRIAVQASVTGNDNDKESVIENISGFCSDTIKKYIDKVEEWGR